MREIYHNFITIMQKKNVYLFTLLVLAILIIAVGVYMSMFYKKTPDDIIGENSDVVVDQESNTLTITDNGEPRVIPKFDIPVSTYDKEQFVKNGQFLEYTGSEFYVGIDVSEHQEDIDWAAVKADGVEFAMIRTAYRGATKGDIYEDTKFKQNIEGAIANDIKVGVYFFSQAVSEQEAEDEATYVLNLIKDYEITYPVVFDWEYVNVVEPRVQNVTGLEVSDFANIFCDKIDKAGYQPMIYTNKSLGYNLYNLEEINKYPIWLAEYDDVPDFYYDFTMLQYTDSGVISGITTAVDLNISFVDYS